jgi:hypothetical protein
MLGNAPAIRVIAIWAALSALPVALRAEVVPLNPLRSGKLPATEAQHRLHELARQWQDEPAQPQVRLVQATEDLPLPEPETVVPQRFGDGAMPIEPHYHAGDEGYDSVAEEHWPGPHPAGRMLDWFFSARWLPIHWFGHSDPNDPYRHWGPGEPLIGTSWRNRPIYFGLFVGGIFNDDLVDGQVLQNNAVFVGARLGYDFDHYWGVEGRYAFARAEAITAAGVPIAESARDYYGDVSLLYYPWGDSRWRPYLSAGVGVANFRFVDDQGFFINDSAFGLPLGIGVKTYYCNWMSLRFDLVDNIAFGTNQLSSMHNFSLMAGVEFRFGGKHPPSYFPWSGNTTYW